MDGAMGDLRPRPARIEDSGDKMGPWMVVVIVVLVWAAFAYLDDIFFIGGGAIICGILLGLVFVGGGLHSQDALRRRMLSVGATLIVLGALGTIYAYERYGWQLEAPRTVTVESFWTQGSTQFIRIGTTIYAVYDLEAWPPVVGQSYCMQLRVPRIRAGSVVSLRAGACNRQESRQNPAKSRQNGSTGAAPIRFSM